MTLLKEGGYKMAKAITHLNKKKPDPVEEQRQAIEQLIEMTADSRNALMDMLECLQEAHDAGLNDIIKGVLKARHKAGAIAIQQMNQPAIYHMVKNLFSVVGLVGSLDSKKMEHLFESVEQGVNHATESINSDTQTSIWDLMKVLKDPDINRAVTMVLGFLKGMGSHLNTVEPERK